MTRTGPDADEHHAAIRALLATFTDWPTHRPSARPRRRRRLPAHLAAAAALAHDCRPDQRRDPDLAQPTDPLGRERAGAPAPSRGGERIAADEVDALIAEPDMQASRTASTAGSAVDAKLLDRIGLTRHQIHVVLSECSGLDLSLREYAHLVGRSYTAIRKDKERALDRIERWVG
jgi:hypothetical protein